MTSGSEEETPSARTNWSTPQVRRRRRSVKLTSGSDSDSDEETGEASPQLACKQVQTPPSGRRKTRLTGDSKEFRTPQSTKRKTGRPASDRDVAETPRSAKRRQKKLPMCSMTVLRSWYQDTAEASGEGGVYGWEWFT